MSLPLCDEQELVRLGLSYPTARAIARTCNQGDFVQLGTGSPVGVVKSNRSKFYIDTSVPTLYYNDNVEDDTNWTAI